MRRNPYFREDREAMRIADRHGLTAEYKTARRHRLTPQEALEDWDLTTNSCVPMVASEQSSSEAN